MSTDSGRVLVVDDDDLVRNLLERHVRAQGHRATPAADGRQALARLREQEFDLVLLDIRMPVMDGFEVLVEIKGDPALRDIPVLVISADIDMDSVVTCIKLGAEDCLFKPFNAVLLNARVRSCLDKKRMREREHAYTLLLEERVAERTALAEQRAAALQRSEEALRRQTILLQSILDSMGDGVVVVDTSGAAVLHNPAAAHLLSERLDDFLPAEPRPQTSFRRSDTVTACGPGDLPLSRAIRGDAVDATELYAAPAGSQPAQWLSVTARPLREQSGAISGGVAVIRDISSAKQAEAALRESEERYALAARGANDGLWDWDLRRNRIFFSARWKEMLGYADDEIGTSPDEWFNRVHPADRERLDIRLSAHFQRLITQFEHEYRITHKDGSFRWMLCRGLAVWDDDNKVVRVAGSQTDITDRKAVEQQLLHEALHDVLTGLPNRALLMDRLGHTIARLRRGSEHRFALLFLDLDRFKTINDSLGHAVGDRLLIEIARRIETCLRPGDTVARMGGDEFTVLLEDLPDDAVPSQVAERIQERISAPLRLGEHSVFTTASIGITLSSLGYDQAADMLRDADTAMYQAKIGGKACSVIFDASMHAHAVAQMQLEADLRQAIEQRELLVYYQPIVSLFTGEITGFEALVRWQHPQRGLLFPKDFLPIAEETGLIVPMSWWVLQEACRQMREWQQQHPSAESLSINVNLASKQLAQPNIVEQLVQVIEETGLSPRSLKIEITEDSLIEYGDASAETLKRIRDLGVQLCIDDFGTGYSSLSQLSHLPVDVLKIDRSFISEIDAASGRTEIVETIISLAQALGIDAVAEGIETQRQVEHLKQFRCDHGQGWLFSRAIDSEQAGHMLNMRWSSD